MLIKTTPSKFFEYVSMGDVERIEIINKREVKVYLTEEASSKDIHKETIKAYFPLSARKASYKFEFGDLQNFENRLKRNEEENNLVKLLIYWFWFIFNYCSWWWYRWKLSRQWSRTWKWNFRWFWWWWTDI